MNKPNLTALLEKAIALARAAHALQVDKAGAPYIEHPLRVMRRCATCEEKIVAVLHDTIEDTDVTVDTLRESGFPDSLIEGVLSVTRQAGESYRVFVARTAQNPIGRLVKIHDLEDNLDLTRFTRELTEKDLKRINKYLHSLRYLTALDVAELTLINE